MVTDEQQSTQNSLPKAYEIPQTSIKREPNNLHNNANHSDGIVRINPTYLESETSERGEEQYMLLTNAHTGTTRFSCASNDSEQEERVSDSGVYNVTRHINHSSMKAAKVTCNNYVQTYVVSSTVLALSYCYINHYSCQLSPRVLLISQSIQLSAAVTTT